MSRELQGEPAITTPEGDQAVADLAIFAVRALQQAIRRDADGALASLELSAAQYSILRLLKHGEKRSAAELAHARAVRPQAMTQLLIELERRGLLERAPHPSHGRIQVVTLTAEGERLAMAGDQLVVTVEGQMLASLTVGERQTLRSLLRRCHDNLVRSNTFDDGFVDEI